MINEKSWGDVAKLTGLEEEGVFDWAVPQTWFDALNKLGVSSNDVRIVWFYPHAGVGHLFGRPVILPVELLKREPLYTTDEIVDLLNYIVGGEIEPKEIIETLKEMKSAWIAARKRLSEKEAAKEEVAVTI